jgi:hypothetical protein
MKHLSQEQISSVVAGLRIPEDAHLQNCAECAQEVERVRNVLMVFRSSVREWTDKLDHSEFPVHEAVASRVRGARPPHRAPMAWVLAAAALAAAVAIPIYQDSRDRELKAQAERDAQLMDDVNAQLSRSGPMAMDPLMQLMTVPISGPATEASKTHGSETATIQDKGGIQ